MQLVLRLVGILGRRAFLSFGVVTFLVAALLAAVNLTSRYALKLYVEDQLRRIPWDLALYQKGGPGATLSNEFPIRVRKVSGIKQVESLAFLRARFPEGAEVLSEVDGKPLATPWLCMLAATDLSLLPPQLQLAMSKPAGGSDDGRGAVLALIGPERSMGKAFLALQGSQNFAINLQLAGQKRALFSTPLHGVIRLERDELNRWFMEQTGSVSFVPYIGVVMLMPYQADILNKFDSVATGMVPIEMAGQGDSETGHVQLAEYVPEVSFLARADRSRLISGWDIPGSLARVTGLCGQAQAAAQNSRWIGAAWSEGPRPLEPFSGDAQGRNAIWSGQGKFIPVDGGHEEGPTGGVSFIVDSTTLVLLQRKQGISELIGLVTFLVALPLLWMAWMLAANLSGLLMLNERRKLGLMRLRGIPGQRMGQALLLAVSSGGFLGGLLGLVLCSTLLLLVYERGHLPLAVLLQPQQLLLFAGFLIITLALALLVSWRLVRYATTISPLEASGRIAGSEAAKAAVRFGPLQGAALLLGAYTLGGLIFHFSMSSRIPVLKPVDQVLDFVGFPLFLYGIATLLVSRKSWIQRLLGPVLRSIGGRLGIFALRHIAVKPHRTVSFLLIVGLMATISLYPLITSRSFADKAVRGAQVQMGTDWQVAFNSPSLVDADKLRDSLGSQMDWLGPQIQKVRDALGQVKGVRSTTYIAEGLLPSFYLPGYGLRGVPIYLIGDVDSYLRNVYSEPELGLGDKFASMIQKFNAGNVAVSPQVADFWNLSPGATVLLGMDAQRKTLFAPDSGTLAFLPGTPPRTVTDRQGFVQARVDYLNYLFSNNAYVVGKAN